MTSTSHPVRGKRSGPAPKVRQPEAEAEAPAEVHPTEVVVSPTPRPIAHRPPEDVVGDSLERYNAAMREKAAPIFAALKLGPVPIDKDNPQVIVWMRSKGVRIKAVMRPEGSFYVLETPPDTT